AVPASKAAPMITTAASGAMRRSGRRRSGDGPRTRGQLKRTVANFQVATQGVTKGGTALPVEGHAERPGRPNPRWEGRAEIREARVGRGHDKSLGAHVVEPRGMPQRP